MFTIEYFSAAPYWTVEIDVTIRIIARSSCVNFWVEGDTIIRNGKGKSCGEMPPIMLIVNDIVKIGEI